MAHFTADDSCTIAFQDRDFPEWHRGRERYGIWMIDAETTVLRQRYERAHHHLADLLVPYRRPLHITLFVCGFLADVVQYNDDFDAAMLQRQHEALEALDLAPFSLSIGGLDSFDSAVFLRVEDRADTLGRLRKALALDHGEFRQAPYLAHVTVGLYREAFDKQEVSQRLAAFEDSEPIELAVQDLHFTSFIAREHDGRLDRLYRHALNGPDRRPHTSSRTPLE